VVIGREIDMSDKPHAALGELVNATRLGHEDGVVAAHKRLDAAGVPEKVRAAALRKARAEAEASEPAEPAGDEPEASEPSEVKAEPAKAAQAAKPAHRTATPPRKMTA
jgi:hypothetical protein